MSKIKVMSMLPRHNESTITSEGEISFDENNIAIDSFDNSKYKIENYNLILVEE